MDADNNLLLLEGAVPGGPNAVVVIRKAVAAKVVKVAAGRAHEEEGAEVAMTVDVVNQQNEKVGSVDLRDEVFGGRVKTDLIHASVVRSNAAERRGTHATKNRALVSGSGKKPWRQKGTGRARVGEIRNPLWRGGGTVFGPQPRSYDYQLPKKVEKGALRAALVAEAAGRRGDRRGRALGRRAVKTKAAVEMLRRLGVEGGRKGKALLVDVKPEDKLALSVRNLEGVRLLASNRIIARDVVGYASRGADARRAREAAGSAGLRCMDRRRQTSFASRSSPRRRPSSARTAARSCSRWRWDANKIDIKRAVELLFGSKVRERPHVARARQDEAPGQVRGPALRLEEGLREAAGRGKAPRDPAGRVGRGARACLFANTTRPRLASAARRR